MTDWHSGLKDPRIRFTGHADWDSNWRDVYLKHVYLRIHILSPPWLQQPYSMSLPDICKYTYLDHLHGPTVSILDLAKCPDNITCICRCPVPALVADRVWDDDSADREGIAPDQIWECPNKLLRMCIFNENDCCRVPAIPPPPPDGSTGGGKHWSDKMKYLGSISLPLPPAPRTYLI
jgi:hypothetical protein